MKNHCSFSCIMSLMIILFISSIPLLVSGQELTSAEKQERCKDHLTRLAKIESEYSAMQKDGYKAERERISVAMNEHTLLLKALESYNTSPVNSGKCRSIGDITDTLTAHYSRLQILYGAPASYLINEISSIKYDLNQWGCEVTSEPRWEGQWLYTDDQGTVDIVGNGAQVSGTSFYAISDWKSTNKFGGCVSTGDNKIKCNFTSAYEDTDKFVDMGGTMEMTITGNSISAEWKEIGPPKIRWKPGRPQYNVSYVWSDGKVFLSTLKRKTL